jgi:hypothetical protein
VVSTLALTPEKSAFLSGVVMGGRLLPEWREHHDMRLVKEIWRPGEPCLSSPALA